MARRDPALGQVPGQQVHPQMPAVGLVGPGVPLLTAQRRRIGRLGQVRNDSRGRQLLGHIPPPGAALQCEMHVIAAGEPGQPPAQVIPVTRHHPAPLHLTGHGV